VIRSTSVATRGRWNRARGRRGSSSANRFRRTRQGRYHAAERGTVSLERGTIFRHVLEQKVADFILSELVGCEADADRGPDRARAELKDPGRIDFDHRLGAVEAEEGIVSRDVVSTRDVVCDRPPRSVGL
jgi:hypothetical protein